MAVIPRITVLGASGGTGLQLVGKLAARSWPTRVLVRNQGVPFILSRHIEICVGDLLRADDVASAIEGSDVVCCLFGPRRRSTEVFCAKATHNVVDAMTAHSVRRLICVTGAMIGDYRRNRTTAFQWAARRAAKRMPDVAADRAGQERIIRESGLDWTIVKPPRLTDGQRKGRVIASHRGTVGLLSTISRRDLAEFIVEEIARPGFIGRAVFVTG